MVDINIQSRQNFCGVEEEDLAPKSTKKRASLGLNFNIQLFKGARKHFNKKNESEGFPKPHSSIREKEFQNKMNQQNSLKPSKELSDFFPHLLRPPVASQTSSHNCPPAVNNSTALSTTFVPILSKCSPNGRFIPISDAKKVNWKRNVNKLEKVEKKTNLENGDENMELEKGNWRRGDSEVKVRKDILSSKNTLLLRDWRSIEENDETDCFCHFAIQNRKWFRKKKPINSRCKYNARHEITSRYIYDESSSSEYQGCRRPRHSAAAHSPKAKLLLSKLPDLQAPSATTNAPGRAVHSLTRNIQGNDPRILPRPSLATQTVSHVSSLDHYDTTSDEEGDVETSLTSSDEGLTSNLSLFTSTEGEDDALASLPRSNDNKEMNRKNDRCCSSSLNFFDPASRPRDVTHEDQILSTHHIKKWNICQEDLNENINPLSRISASLTSLTSVTATPTKATVSRIRTKTSDYPLESVNSSNNLSNKVEKFARENCNSKLGPQKENIYLAIQTKRDATFGISAKVINNELVMRKDLSSGVYFKDYLQYFDPDLLTGKPFNESRKLLPILYSNLGEGQGTTCKGPLAALVSTKEDIADLSTRLDIVSREKERFETSLTNAQLARARVERETPAKLDSVAQQYEERITELHSVIAELTRKLDRQRDDVIIEEDEEDEVDDGGKGRRRRARPNREKKDGDEERISLSEFSSQEQNETTECSTSETAESDAIFDREETNGDTNPRPSTDISTSCEIDDRAVEAGECIADLDVSGCREASNNSNLSTSHPFHDNDDITTDDVICQGSSSAGLEEEVKLLREENNNLQQALALVQHKVTNQRSAIMALSREREILRKKLKEFERMQPGIPLSSPHISDAIMVKGLRGSPFSGALSISAGATLDTSVHGSLRAVSPSVTSQHQEELSPPQDGVRVICKLAERVRLKKAESGDLRVTGSDLSSVGVSTTGVAEQLAASVQEESDAQELFHALATAGGAFAPHERLKEYELEAERLHARIDHLRSQNEVLNATLSESKACCDRLALKTGRAEAQSGALKMGVEVLDQIQEAFEVLTALLEAQIALLAVTCQVTGVELGVEMGFDPGDQDVDPLIRVKRAQEQRRTAENVARHLLSRLHEKNSSPAPETNGMHSMSVSSRGSYQEEYMLRSAISRLQEERTRILSCIKGNSDSSPGEDYFPIKPPLNDLEAHKLDLENAVLMQELTAIREDRAELRAQVYLLEREKAGLELRIGTCEAQATAYCVTIDHLKSQLNQLKGQPNNSHESVGDSGVDTASSEVESLRRENQLKTRVDDLVMTLEKVTKNSEARHQQSQEFISDLKKANSALLTAVDRLKKKYTLRVRRMEQQTTNLVAKHEQQVKALKLRVANLEDQLRCDTMLPHQSSSVDVSY